MRAAAILAGALLSLGGVSATRAATSSEAGLAKPPLPGSLSAAESNAEDIVDYALGGDRGNVVATAVRLRAAANGPVATALSRSGVPRLEIAELRRRARRVAGLAQRGAFIDVALAANAVSQLMPSFYGRFRHRVPAGILGLDYLDREAELRSIAHQPAKVALAVEGLERAWPLLRPKVVAAGGRREAIAFDRHVAVMRRLDPGTGNSVETEAARGLELVDELEHVFTR